MEEKVKGKDSIRVKRGGMIYCEAQREEKGR